MRLGGKPAIYELDAMPEPRGFQAVGLLEFGKCSRTRATLTPYISLVSDLRAECAPP